MLRPSLVSCEHLHAPFFSASAFCSVIIETPAAVNTFVVVVIDVPAICGTVSLTALELHQLLHAAQRSHIKVAFVRPLLKVTHNANLKMTHRCCLLCLRAWRLGFLLHLLLSIFGPVNPSNLGYHEYFMTRAEN